MPRRKRKAQLPDAFKENIERVRSGEIKPKARSKKATQGKRSASKKKK